jgi:hypothetical protein
VPTASKHTSTVTISPTRSRSNEVGAEPWGLRGYPARLRTFEDTVERERQRH